MVNVNLSTEPCPSECGHTDEQHNAFDSGVVAGKEGKGWQACPFPESSGLYHDWQTGHSVGFSQRELKGTMWEAD